MLHDRTFLCLTFSFIAGCAVKNPSHGADETGERPTDVTTDVSTSDISTTDISTTEVATIDETTGSSSSGETNVDSTETETETEGWVEDCQTIPLPTPKVMLVVDRSKSMGTESIGQFTHWELTTMFAEELGDTLHGNYGDLVETGLRSYPQEDPPITPSYFEEYCNVEGPPERLPEDGDVALNALGGQPLAGASPLRKALEEDVYPLLETGPSHRNAAIVITDGAPNCPKNVDPDDSMQAFMMPDYEVEGIVEEHADNEGIRTFVVGIGTNEPAAEYMHPEIEASWPSEDALMTLADAGGTGEYRLIAGHNDISIQAHKLARQLYCDIRLPFFPPFAPDFDISFMFENDVFLGEDESCAEADGVEIDETPDGTRLIFCGFACDRLIELGGEVTVCGILPGD